MVDIIPLATWYPSMHTKWVARLAALAAVGVKVLYPLTERDGWTIHHSVGGASTAPLAYARQVADQHWASWQRPGGYNFMVATDGNLYEMCGFVRAGAHAGTTFWNRATLGLCFQGDYRDVTPAAVMVEAATELIASTPIPQTQWTHRQVRPEPTTCPGAKIEALLPLEGDEDVQVAELIREIQTAINRTPVTPKLNVNGVWDEQTANRFVTALQLGTGSGSGLTEAEVKAIVAATKLQP